MLSLAGLGLGPRPSELFGLELVSLDFFGAFVLTQDANYANCATPPVGLVTFLGVNSIQ